MAEITLAAHTGRVTGSRASGRLRAEGKVPGTVYGLGEDAVAVTVEWRALRHALVGDAGLNALINLDLGGDSMLTIVKELQRHPTKRQVLHVDFLRVDRDQVITVEVPVVLSGEAEAVLRGGGLVEQALFHLTIEAKPGDIPDEITLDISTLELGGVIRVGDLDLPAGATTQIDDEEPVVMAAVPQAELPEPTEGEEDEGAAEGEAADDAAGDD